jgi:hypothetical protein
MGGEGGTHWHGVVGWLLVQVMFEAESLRVAACHPATRHDVLCCFISCAVLCVACCVLCCAVLCCALQVLLIRCARCSSWCTHQPGVCAPLRHQQHQQQCQHTGDCAGHMCQPVRQRHSLQLHRRCHCQQLSCREHHHWHRAIQRCLLCEWWELA